MRQVLYMAKHAHLPDVVIHYNDTDVLVILRYHLGTENIKVNVCRWMQVLIAITLGIM